MSAQQWIDSTEDKYLLEHASGPSNPSRLPTKQGREAGTLSRDLENLQHFSIRLTIRLFDIVSSLNIGLLRNVEAYQVLSLVDLRSYVNEIATLELRRPAVKCSFAFEDGRKLEWEIGSVEDQDKLYQQYLGLLKSQGEREVLMRNDAVNWEIGEGGYVVKEE